LHPQTASGTPGLPATAELGISEEIDGGPDVGHAPAPGLGHAAGVGSAVGVAVAVAVGVAVVVGVGATVAVGVEVGTGAPLPSPVIAILSDLPLALLIVKFADFLPSDNGVNTIDMSQRPSAAKLVTQSCEATNCPLDELMKLTSTAIEFGL
jgi:hypothetical protein